MLGYTGKNNDIYLFLENNELGRLEEETIKGIYLNLKEPTKKGELKMWVDEKINPNEINISTMKTSDGIMSWMDIQMGILKYEELKKDGALEEHEGFRHLCFTDANRLEFHEISNYNQLKYWANINFVDSIKI